MQLDLEPVLTHGAGRLRYWVGYSWTYPPGLLSWAHACVVGPRWAARAAGEWAGPVCLDNGAFPAWRDNVELSTKDMLAAMAGALSELGDRVGWAVLPDIVGGGRASFARSVSALSEARQIFGPDCRLFVAAQEGMDLDDVVALSDAEDLAVFIGGATYAWKRAATEALSGRVGHLHVARVWSDGDLHFVSSRADTFDNTTYTRQQNWNTRLDFDTIARRYLEPAQEAS